MPVAGEDPKVRKAVQEMAHELHKASQQARGEGKRPATEAEARQRAIEVARRHDERNRR